ncbi:MAG: phosphatidylglycerophosphatase A [Rhodocyclaceae bacterium]|nr:phosphatidylglycerophosphatase A [Rhodocyclaceae bacterium]
MNIKRSPPPPPAFLLAHPAHLIACGFGSGLSPWASGTVGTAFAWATYPLLRALLPHDLFFAAFLALAFAVGVLACEVTGRNLGLPDHGAIVWDEIVPFWCVLFLAPSELAWQLAAFLAFRFFDVAKPPPARAIDERLKNGLGVMLDDLVAAAYALILLSLIKTAASWLD